MKSIVLWHIQCDGHVHLWCWNANDWMCRTDVEKISRNFFVLSMTWDDRVDSFKHPKNKYYISPNERLDKVTLSDCPPPARCPASCRVTRSSLCERGQCACLFVCFWQGLFSQALLSLWFSVAGMAGERRGAFTPICHRLSSLAPVSRTHPRTNPYAHIPTLATLWRPCLP